MVFKFYDTCSLLLKADNLWDENSQLVISSITLEELENIKTAANKDADVKYAARKIVHELEEHYGEYKVVLWKQSYMNHLIENDLPDYYLKQEEQHEK